ncbi:hypothetical protein B0G77_6654 [Paraburkholderia sp. BL10I2N1]|nr:hypothetical protein B0G77_6654 [Paraburkholderia sp. BL10I2N1]
MAIPPLSRCSPEWEAEYVVSTDLGTTLSKRQSRRLRQLLIVSSAKLPLAAHCRMSFPGVRRAKAALFPAGASPARQPLQPEATGAIVEVTKRLKPSVKRVTKYGDSASVQAVTRVNAEQASKKDDAQADLTAISGKASMSSKLSRRFTRTDCESHMDAHRAGS